MGYEGSSLNQGVHYKFSDSGEWVFVKIPRCLVILTPEKWTKGIRRGKSIIRNRQRQAREAGAVDRKIGTNFPRFE